LFFKLNWHLLFFWCLQRLHLLPRSSFDLSPSLPVSYVRQNRAASNSALVFFPWSRQVQICFITFSKHGYIAFSSSSFYTFVIFVSLDIRV
jgi:hypothetical protein